MRTGNKEEKAEAEAGLVKLSPLCQDEAEVKSST